MAFLKDENIYDVIVVGVGSMGSAACYYLAKSGLNVLGLEQFELVHERGSHTGESRFVRMAYFEHPDYVPLLRKSYENWDHIEEVSGEKLFHKSGIVYFGTAESEQITGVKESASLYELDIEEVSIRDAKTRFSNFELPDNYETIYEANAGFAMPEKTIRTYAKQAISQGAKILTQATLHEWEYKGGCINCNTTKGIFKSKKIVFTAGAWTQSLVPELRNKLQVTQQLLVWYRPTDIDKYREDNFKCWSIADPAYDGMFYGFPVFNPDNPTIKLAYHARGIEKSVEDKDNNVTPEEFEPIKFFFKKYMPTLNGEIAYTKTCLYNYSEDEDFIIDKLPDYDDDVIVACGFSGHGFKFVPMVGEVLKDLVINGETVLPIDFLKIR